MPHRIISLTMVKNEQDIIEPFIRHNARFMDCMIVIDNASVDETRRIAMDCARELGNVIVADNEEFGYTQAERMTRLLHGCQTAFFADYVVPLDADEFVGAADRGTLLATLERISPGGVGLMPWQTFVLSPAEASSPTSDPPRSMRLRRIKEMPRFYKAVPRFDGNNRADLILEQGNHDITTISGERLPAIRLDDLPLLHFPVRGVQQFTVKSVVGWMAYLAKDPGARDANYGSQWRDSFHRVVSGRVGPAELAELSMRYAQTRLGINWDQDVVASEPPSNYVRRYSTGMFGDPLELISRSWERSLSPPPGLLRLTRPATIIHGPRAAATSFDAIWHWDNLFVDVAPFRFIAEKYRPDTVLDIGCGIGGYLTLFKRLVSSAVLGVDGIPADATVLGGEEYLLQDLTRPLVLDRLFDLVICTEVAEHMEAQYADILLDSVTRHAGRTIIFSAAEPGQPGHCHINCQPISHWLERLASRGWYPVLMDSLGIRALATMSWFRRNLIVLRRDDPLAGAAVVLAAIGAKPFTWYAQQHGIRQYAFSETLPPSPDRHPDQDAARIR